MEGTHMREFINTHAGTVFFSTLGALLAFAVGASYWASQDYQARVDVVVAMGVTLSDCHTVTGFEDVDVNEAVFDSDIAEQGWTCVRFPETDFGDIVAVMATADQNMLRVTYVDSDSLPVT